jgi:plasmid stabilization system protein ParE
MPEVDLHESADDELRAAISFYESRQTGLGDAFLKRVSEGFELIKGQPLASQILSVPFRRHLVRQFPYSIVYRLEGERIFVLAVAHWSRRPDYWKART